MARLAIRRDAIPLHALQQAFDTPPDPVRLGEPAVWVDDNGDEWWIFSDTRLSPEQAGRVSAMGQGKSYRKPDPPDDPGPDFDPFEHEIKGQGQTGRRPVTVRVSAQGLRPKPTEEEL